MLKFAHLLVKSLLFLIATVFLLVVISSVYIVINKERLVGEFLKNVEEQVELNFKYSTIELSIVSHFPFAAFTFNDLSVNYPLKSGANNLLEAKQLSLTINTINIIRGKYNIKNCIVETGGINYYPKTIDSLLNQFISQEHNTSESTANITINKFQLKNFDIHIFDNQNKSSTKFRVINSALMLNMKSDYVEFFLKSDIEKIIVNNKSITDIPLKIEGHIIGNNNLFIIKYLGVSYNSIMIELTGNYDDKTELLKLNYASNHFNLKDFADFIPSNSGVSNIIGKSKVFGSLEYNSKLHTLNFLEVGHSSKGSINLNDKTISVLDLKGTSKFSNNFKQHNTNINLINLKYDCYTAKLAAKIKGINNATILTEGDIKIENPNLTFLNKAINLEANGSVKLLLSISNLQSSEKTRIKYHNIKGLMHFSINKIDDIKRISNISGEIKLDNQLEILSNGTFDNEPFDLIITQSAFLGVMNDKITLTPKIEIKAKTLDVDYFIEFLDQLPEDDTASKTNTIYSVKLSSEDLKFFDYRFKNVTSNIYFFDNMLEIQSFSGNGFEGKIQGSLKNKDSQYVISADFSNININKLFQHYRNFNQTVVTSENISGDLSGNALLSFKTDDKGEIMYPSLKLESDIILQNGKLVGMNKIEKLSKWLKLDQVKSIDFKTLHNRIEINNQCVRIPKMDVMSNVVNMQLSGEHYFSGNFTYWMKINFSQVLSRRFLNFSSSKENNSSDGSINLYLKFTGDSNDYEIKLDKKSSFEKIKGNFESDGIIMKDILLEEFKQIIRKDTLLKSKVTDSISKQNPKFTIEWDEYDTLKVENN